MNVNQSTKTSNHQETEFDCYKRVNLLNSNVMYFFPFTGNDQ